MAIRLAIGTKDTLHILTLHLGSGGCTQEREIASPELRGVARFGDTLLVGQRDRVSHTDQT